MGGYQNLGLAFIFLHLNSNHTDTAQDTASDPTEPKIIRIVK